VASTKLKRAVTPTELGSRRVMMDPAAYADAKGRSISSVSSRFVVFVCDTTVAVVTDVASWI
jgi:hypothetical protein